MTCGEKKNQNLTFGNKIDPKTYFCM